MHWPPPNAAVKLFEQNDIEPLLSLKVQHLLLLDSVQSAFLLQRRSTWVPLHDMPVFVPHDAPGTHATIGGSVVQFGIEPPVTLTTAQQTFPPEQSEGDAHAGPEGAASGIELELPLSFAEGAGAASVDDALEPASGDEFAEEARCPASFPTDVPSSTKFGPFAALHADSRETPRTEKARWMFFIQTSVTTRNHARNW